MGDFLTEHETRYIEEKISCVSGISENILLSHELQYMIGKGTQRRNIQEDDSNGLYGGYGSRIDIGYSAPGKMHSTYGDLWDLKHRYIFSYHKRNFDHAEIVECDHYKVHRGSVSLFWVF